MPMVRKRAIVRGRVQGVFYRDSTRSQARALGVNGWVRNLPDGSVEVVAEGEAAQVASLLAWCRQGPPAARVDEVVVEEEPYQGEYRDFFIRYD